MAFATLSMKKPLALLCLLAPWLRRPHSYVVIVCTRGADAPAPLMAASGPVERKTSWLSNELPASPITAEEDPNGLIAPERQRFDLAPYYDLSLKSRLSGATQRLQWSTAAQTYR